MRMIFACLLSYWILVEDRPLAVITRLQLKNVGIPSSAFSTTEEENCWLLFSHYTFLAEEQAGKL